ncbi:hypothetical protein ABIB90_006101 [Bradyrhizobium sp. JR4.1]|uniref:DUF4145 domain-containing protein n=1 Tax=unclassified Bradyrhizobium TaxID=2631580 RepID=UPI003396817B
MATFTHKCPHCLTEHIALRARLGMATPPHSGKFSAHLDCPKCNKPSCVILKPNGHNKLEPSHWDSHQVDLTNHGWQVEQFWPPVPGPNIPEALPTDIERIYLQAERNFPIQGNEEPAGTMYRKALDVGLKKIDSETKGVLAVRIKKLAAAGKLTADIAEWADHVRDLGNEAAHEDEPPTRKELTDLRNITEMVMRYLFSLPALVLARRPKPDEPAK